MNVGAAVLTFREGLEAALVIAILLGYLRKIDWPAGRRLVWVGAALAIAFTVGFVALLETVGAGFEGRSEKVYEGITSILAVGMVTYMTFWMARRGRYLKGELEAGAQASLSGEHAAWGLVGLVFFTIVREGIETGLFLSAAAFASSGVATLTGGLAGLIAAVAVAMAIYAGGLRLQVGLFFRISGLLLVVFGAAILRYGVHEFEEVGLIPPLVEHVWNTSQTLDDSDGPGALLKVLVGYTSSPSLMQIILFLSYYLLVGLALWRPWKGQAATSQVAREVA